MRYTETFTYLMSKAVATQLVELEELQRQLTEDFTTLDQDELQVLSTVDMLIDDCLINNSTHSLEDAQRLTEAAID